MPPSLNILVADIDDLIQRFAELKERLEFEENSEQAVAELNDLRIFAADSFMNDNEPGASLFREMADRLPYVSIKRCAFCHKPMTWQEVLTTDRAIGGFLNFDQVEQLDLDGTQRTERPRVCSACLATKMSNAV
jgi:hypothetical protein